MENIDKIRGETPSCENIIHFNNAGAALSPQSVTQTVIDHLHREQTHGGYEAAKIMKTALEDFYHNAANLIHCRSNEIAFIENATRAWDMIFYSLPLQKGDSIITGLAEYGSNFIAMLQVAKKREIQIKVIPDDSHGQIDLNQLEDAIDGTTKLIAITHIPTGNGLINPAEDVGKIAKKHQIPYLLDACQSLGHIEVNVKKIQCDFLCATGRKYLRGPRGTGFLFATESQIKNIEPIFLDIHAATWTNDHTFEIRGDAKRFETWETNIAAKLGLSEAISYCRQIGISNIEKRIVKLSEILRHRLKDLPEITLLDHGNKLSGIVTMTTKLSEDELCRSLHEKGINTSVSYLEYSRLNFSPKNIKSALRASVHYYNTEREIENFVATTKEILASK